ncbi:retinol dehydrogenase 13-like [Parambassis ranga]|uniref:Retinol dehydrogenase 13-like n=1 Tax=Parambassis ranga TaxID=210632 RepID=A0A6P7KCJ1_9TELE|nr:retinol dehydrogenase 13-like [Parambassis ranga]
MATRIITAASEFVSNHPKTIAAVTLTGLGLFGVKKWMAGGVCHSKARLDGKTILITGANTGIGKETALDLARRGARVILACRDMDRANTAAEDVRNQSGNGNVIVKKLDLASLQSVRELAHDVLASEERLDVLINNAGVMSCPRWQTEDGFEMQFGVNHLGHFLLTNCLLDLLKKSSPSRIINVSSLAHEKGQIYFDDINQEKDYNPWKSYGQSKLANVLFTRELAKKLQGTGVTAYSLHPGVIRTELGRHLWPTIPLWKRVVYLPFMFFIKSATDGAQTTIYCAVEESLQNDSGLYYSDCAPKKAASQGLDDEAAKKLWDLSASMVGLT